MKKVIAALLVASVAMSAMFANGTKEPVSSADASKEPIRIGAMYALSGDKAAIGNNIMRGVDFAAEMINAQGGVNGRMIEVVRGDT